MSDRDTLESAADSVADLDCVTWVDYRNSADPCLVVFINAHELPPEVQDVLVSRGLSVDMAASGTRTGPKTTEVIAR